MIQLRFNHQQRKRKTWLFPLIVIILLYISIPFLLIQRGDETIKKAISQTEDQSVEIPSKEYGAGVVFLEIAEAFPGFTGWAEQIREKSDEKMLEIYKSKCNHKNSELFKQISDYTDEYDSLLIQFEYSNNALYLKAIVFTNHEKENLKIMIPDELRNELQYEFCKVWKEFFQDIDLSIPKNNSICQL